MGIGSKVIVIALGFIIPRIVLVNYGSDVNGVITSIGQIFGYMALLEAGIGRAARNMLYKPIVNRDRDGVSYVASVAQRYFRKFTFFYGIGVVLLSIFIPLMWNTNVDKSTIFLLVFFEGMSGVLSFWFTQTPSIILEADGKSYVNNLVGSIKTILYSIAKIVIVSLAIRIDALQYAYFLITIVRVIIYKLYFKKNYNWINYKLAPPKTKLKERTAYVIDEIAWTVFSSTDLIVLSTFASTSMSSVYSIYNMVYGAISTLTTAIYNSVSYLLGQAFFEDIKKYEKVHDAFMSVFIGVQTIIMSATYILILPFIELYTKGIADVNYIYRDVPLLFCLIQMLSWSRYITGNLASIAGFAKQISVVSLAEAIMNILFSLLLVGKYGISGVLWATVIALPVKVVYCAYISDKKVFGRSYRKTFSILGINYLMFTIILCVNNYIKIDIVNIADFVVKGVIITAVCSVVGISANLLVNPECIKMIKFLFEKRRKGRNNEHNQKML